MKMKNILLNLVLLLLTFTATWANVPKAVIIFDASGSMWGQVDGKAKISIAKEALQDVVKKWNPEVALGLTVYGHRTKGDCADIETVVPVGKIDKQNILNIVKNIQPKGKTPISATLKKVAKEMKFSEEKATIILISDGKESCDADPCATAKELEKQGIDFVAHVIGFNVDKNTDAQLECIASATGGAYFSAKDATALNDAMDSIVKKVEKPKPVVDKPKILKDNLKVSTYTKDAKPISSNHIYIYKVDGTDAYGKPNLKKITYVSYEKSASFTVPSGKYVVKADTGNGVYAEANVTIEPSKGKEIKLVYDAGFLKVSTYTKDAKPISSNHIYIYKVDGTDAYGKPNLKKITYVSYEKSASFTVPSGKYVVKADTDDKKGEQTVKIEPSKGTEIKLILEDPRVKACVKARQGNASIEGKWDTADWPSMTLHQKGNQVQGTYDFKNGKLMGEMQGTQQFVGHWTQDSSQKKCDTQKETSYYWGRIVINFNSNFCKFKSEWTYCDETKKKSFEGVFVAPLEKKETPSKEELIKADTPSKETNSTKDEK